MNINLSTPLEAKTRRIVGVGAVATAGRLLTGSRFKIPHRQGRKINGYIIRQNLVLPEDFKLPDLPSDKTQDFRPAVGEEKVGQYGGTAAEVSLNFDPLSLIKKSITPRPAAPKPFKIEFEEDRKNKGLKLGLTEEDVESGHEG